MNPNFRTRAYQRAAISALWEGWNDREVTKQLLAMATGTGKTVIFSLLAAEEAARGGRTLILAHTDELVAQALEKFEAVTGTMGTMEKAQRYADPQNPVVVGSVQTLCRSSRLDTWPEDHFSLVVVDEAHRSLANSYQKVLGHFPRARVVGVTATVDRGDRRSLGEYYQKVAFEYDLLKAVREGWLVRPVVKAIPLEIDLNGVATTRSLEGYDLDRAETARRLIPFMGQIAQAIKAEAGTGKLLVFLPSVETAELMADHLNRAGVSSRWICGDKDLCPNRAALVKDHKEGKFQCLTNMAVLTEGYDDDEVETIVCLRPTKLRNLYCQIIGRGTRPHGTVVAALNMATNALERAKVIKESVKPHVRVLDFLWLYEKHKLCSPASLVTADERVADEMKGKDGDLITLENEARADLLAKLAAELRKNRNRKARVVDPLAVAAELGDVELTDYSPKTERDERPVTERQALVLQRNGIDVTKVTCLGHASALIDKILLRHRAGLCTIRQINWLAKHGVDATQLSREEASAKQEEMIARWQGRKVVPDMSELF